MICSKCGNENQNDSCFCCVCGSKLSINEHYSEGAMIQTTVSVKPKNRNPLVLAISSVVLLLIILITIFIVRSNSPSHRLREQLDLGNRYLSEMNYEQAIAAYEAAIEIDSKNVESYVGLVNAYLGQGNSEGVFKTYEMATANLDEDSMEGIRDTVSNGVMTIITDNLEAGDKTTARELAYSLADIDMKSAERAIFYVSNYSGHTEDDSSNINEEITTNDLNAQEETVSDVQEEIILPYTIGADGYVIFGHFEQDNNLSNGMEPIKWIILNDDGNRLLLLSDKILYGFPPDCGNAIPYEESTYNGVTYEFSDVRMWLNGTFYNTAFDENEKSYVVQSLNENPGIYTTSWSGDQIAIPGGNSTYDYVFLLSIDEARRYMLGAAYKTRYAVEEGHLWIWDSNEVNEPDTWILRSPVNTQVWWSGVGIDGIMDMIPPNQQSYYGIRPAIYLSYQ